MTSTPSENPKAKISPKLLAGAAILVAVVVAAVGLCSQGGIFKIYRNRQEISRLEADNARLAEENARLARTIDRLQHDPEMIQDLIRRELNFVRKNEIIFQLPPETGIKAPEPAPTEAAPRTEAPPPPRRAAALPVPNPASPKAKGKAPAGPDGNTWAYLEAGPQGQARQPKAPPPAAGR